MKTKKKRSLPDVEHFFPRIQVETCAQMHTRVKLLEGMQMKTILTLLGGYSQIYWGDISPHPPRVSAPLLKWILLKRTLFFRVSFLLSNRLTALQTLLKTDDQKTKMPFLYQIVIRSELYRNVLARILTFCMRHASVYEGFKSLCVFRYGEACVKVN